MRSPTKGLLSALVPLVVALVCAPGCLDDVEIGAFTSGSAGASSAGAPSGGAASAGAPSAGAASGTGATGGAAGEGGSPSPEGGAPADCVPVPCLGKIYACGDCEDNDGDGAVDALDVECLGACDDTEDSFAGLTGQTNASCRQDCYFDHDAGSGNDGCYYSHACDALSVGPDYPPSGNASCEYDEDAKIPGTQASCSELRAEQPEACLEYCKPLVPNGCDCFGCCELPARSGRFVFVGSTIDGVPSCNEDTLGDSEACKPCTPVPSCFERCDDCEICVGEVRPGPGCESAERCGGEVPPCGADVAEPCSADSYCVTGCCIPIPK
jgi:hypothetical protein